MVMHQKARKGSLYISVLGVAMVVSIIGLSSVMISRLELRSAHDTQLVTEAGVLSQSAIEWGITRINADSNWRNTYTNDAWQPDQAFGNGLFSFKLVADSGDLTNPANGDVNIVGRGVVSRATQLCSVRVNNSVVSLGAQNQPAMSA